MPRLMLNQNLTLGSYKSGRCLAKGLSLRRSPRSLCAGCFHFEECMRHLVQQHGHRVWAMDFIGQGRSWPREAQGLTYSVDLWTEQVHMHVLLASWCKPVRRSGKRLHTA